MIVAPYFKPQSILGCITSDVRMIYHFLEECWTRRDQKMHWEKNDRSAIDDHSLSRTEPKVSILGISTDESAVRLFCFSKYTTTEAVVVAIW